MFYKPAFCSKIVQKSKSCSRLLEQQKVAPNAKSCSNVAKHNRDRPSSVHKLFLSYRSGETSKCLIQTLLGPVGKLGNGSPVSKNYNTDITTSYTL